MWRIGPNDLFYYLISDAEIEFLEIFQQRIEWISDSVWENMPFLCSYKLLSMLALLHVSNFFCTLINDYVYLKFVPKNLPSAFVALKNIDAVDKIMV